MDNLYPAGPATVPAGLTRPSSKYKLQAWTAVASLSLFLAAYLSLAIWFAWTAYASLMQARAGGDNIVLLIAIGVCASFLALFMLKALFFRISSRDPGALEITEKEQPSLFAFLHRLADEAGAPRPKRVFVSPRVNACVFYDLSPLNLLFPSRKNLEIGLALINVLTLSELKAVLAHEFGHFAQRSMAIGSWVYIAQQIAGQIVAKRDALDKLLRFISRIDIRIAWIGWLLSLVVWSIRSLVDSLLQLTVLAQRALSRQMEFQADLVAVSLTGSDELVHALHKLQAADEAWERTLSFANSELSAGRLPHDLFAVQRRIIDKVGSILDDENYGKVDRECADPANRRIFAKSFARPPEMWSTHPANADREENAKSNYVASPHDERSAWVLFVEQDKLKSDVILRLIGEAKAELTEEQATFEALNKVYDRVQFSSCYRGAYLGRSLTRHVSSSSELYDETLAQDITKEMLASLYGPDLSGDLTRLRELEEERATLQALLDKVYRADGGRLIHRGREISRRELPSAIQTVRQEEDEVRQAIWQHDRRCRSVHIAAADKVGKGYKPFLQGLLSVLHYAEHTLADLRDAHGLLGNVLAVVMADRKVSSRELDRLLSVANPLRGLMARIDMEKQDVVLDGALLKRLDKAQWAEDFEELKLPAANRQNIGDWLGAVDGWVQYYSERLAALATAALEELLHTELRLAEHLRTAKDLGPAPTPSCTPADYTPFVLGQERERQKRLGLWDRFQTADGWVAATSRFIVAGLVVGSVLGFSLVMGNRMVISVFNGLAQPVEVSLADKTIVVPAFSANEVDLVLPGELAVTTRTLDGRMIEQFTPAVSSFAPLYVYNVAGATPLVEWTAVYGDLPEQPPRLMGSPRWTTSVASIVFAEPPETIESSGKGGTRTVLTAVVEGSPAERLGLVANESERTRMVAAHANWDGKETADAAGWHELMQMLEQADQQ